MPISAVDTAYVTRILLELLAIPSPTGFTHDAVAYLQNELASLGVTSSLTPKGAFSGRCRGGCYRARRGAGAGLEQSPRTSTRSARW